MKSLLLICSMALVSQVAFANYEPSEVVLQTMAMESASEPDGLVYVAKVIQTRSLLRNLDHGAVVLQPKQFSCWNQISWAKNWLKKHYTPEVRQACMRAWYDALEADIEPITHYHTIGTAPYWAKGHKPVYVVGGHRFYKGIK